MKKMVAFVLVIVLTTVLGSQGQERRKVPETPKVVPPSSGEAVLPAVAVPRPPAAVNVTKWEYKVWSGTPDENALNELGSDGWELTTSHGVQGKTGQTVGAYLIFKRPKR